MDVEFTAAVGFPDFGQIDTVQPVFGGDIVPLLTSWRQKNF